MLTIKFLQPTSTLPARLKAESPYGKQTTTYQPMINNYENYLKAFRNYIAKYPEILKHTESPTWSCVQIDSNSRFFTPTTRITEIKIP